MRPLTRKSTYKALALSGAVGAAGLGALILGANHLTKPHEQVAFRQDGDVRYQTITNQGKTEYRIMLTYNGPERVESPWIDLILDENKNFVSACYEGKMPDQRGPISLDDPKLGDFLQKELAKAQAQLGKRQ